MHRFSTVDLHQFLCSKWCCLLYGMQSCIFAGFTGLSTAEQAVISHYTEMQLWACSVYAVHPASVQQRLGSWTLRSRTFLLWITHPFTEAICMMI
jgi:hypothetical protein